MTEGEKIAKEVWDMLPDDCKKIMKNLKRSFMESITADVDEVINKNSFNLPVSSPFRCWLKDSAENEKVLVRESKNGLKYLIFDDETISYARVGTKIGEQEVIHFDGKNGRSIINAWSNEKQNMETARLITFENYKQFVGKKVEVEICCYEGGMMYPDNNILAGMNEGYFYFLSEQGTEDEQMWHWEAKDKGKLNCSIRVWADGLCKQCFCNSVDDIKPYYDIDDDIFRCDKCDKHFC